MKQKLNALYTFANGKKVRANVGESCVEIKARYQRRYKVIAPEIVSELCKDRFMSGHCAALVAQPQPKLKTRKPRKKRKMLKLKLKVRKVQKQKQKEMKNGVLWDEW